MAILKFVRAQEGSALAPGTAVAAWACCGALADRREENRAARVYFWPGNRLLFCCLSMHEMVSLYPTGHLVFVEVVPQAVRRFPTLVLHQVAPVLLTRGTAFWRVVYVGAA